MFVPAERTPPFENGFRDSRSLQVLPFQALLWLGVRPFRWASRAALDTRKDEVAVGSGRPGASASGRSMAAQARENAVIDPGADVLRTLFRMTRERT